LKKLFLYSPGLNIYNMDEAELPLLPIVFDGGDQVRHDGSKGADCCTICCCLFGCWPCSIARHASTSCCSCKFKPLRAAWVCLLLNQIFTMVSNIAPPIPLLRVLRIFRVFAAFEVMGNVVCSYIF